MAGALASGSMPGMSFMPDESEAGFDIVCPDISWPDISTPGIDCELCADIKQALKSTTATTAEICLCIVRSLPCLILQTQWTQDCCALRTHGYDGNDGRLNRRPNRGQAQGV